MRPTRRRQLLSGAAALAAGAAVDAFGIEPRWLQVTTHRVPIEGLPNGLANLRIAHLTDLHLSSIGAIERAVLEAVAMNAPDLVFLTGDMIDAPNRLSSLRELCRALATPGRSIVATWGNWEHWGRVGSADLRGAYASVGVRLLGDTNRRLPCGLVVASTDDSCSGYADLASALWRLPDGPGRIFLTHAPGLFDDLPDGVARFDLCLAGHTHGGQVRVGRALLRPPGSGSFDAGWYDTRLGRLYVSRGIGTSIYPARLMCRPEVAVFTLVA
jgi:predicted MPP superfamily phosphohydrolase